MYPWLDLYAPYLALAALALSIIGLILGLWAWRQLKALRAQYQALTAGTAGGNLEAVLDQHMENVRLALEKADEARQTALRIELEGRSHVQHVAVVRYNPFSNTGGDQSFVLAIADQRGDGALVNSLHTRDGTRIYAKPLTGWESTYTLNEEEMEAINRARATTGDTSLGNGKA